MTASSEGKDTANIPANVGLTGSRFRLRLACGAADPAGDPAAADYGTRVRVFKEQMQRAEKICTARCLNNNKVVFAVRAAKNDDLR